MTETFEKLSNNFCSRMRGRATLFQSLPLSTPSPHPSPSKLQPEINTRKCVKQASVEIITWILIYELCGAREMIMTIIIKSVYSLLLSLLLLLLLPASLLLSLRCYPNQQFEVWVIQRNKNADESFERGENSYKAQSKSINEVNELLSQSLDPRTFNIFSPTF